MLSTLLWVCINLAVSHITLGDGMNGIRENNACLIGVYNAA